jgi:hypothetical protein
MILCPTTGALFEREAWTIPYGAGIGFTFFRHMGEGMVFENLLHGELAVQAELFQNEPDVQLHFRLINAVLIVGYHILRPTPRIELLSSR